MLAPLLDLLRGRGLEPHHVAATSGGEYACPCPGCGGKDRFRVWPEAEGGAECDKGGVRGRWMCRQCGKKGDAVEFLREFGGLTWSQAWEHLRLPAPATIRGRLPFPPKSAQRPTFAPKSWEAPADRWRAKAAELVERAHAALLKRPEDLAWLAARGLPLEAVRACRLGWLEGENGRQGVFRDRAAWGLEPKTKQGADGVKVVKRTLFIPRGVVIPAFGPGGGVQRLRIRRTNEDTAAWGDKYMVVEGSCMAPLLLGLEPRAVVVVEAELDALAVHHAAGDLAGSLAVLTNVGRPDEAAHQVLSRSLCILVALDFDKAGAAGWTWWRETYPQARRWPVPAGKDPGDAVKLGVSLREWVQAGLPPVMTMNLGASVDADAPSREGSAGPESTARPRERAGAASPDGRWVEIGPGLSVSADIAAMNAEVGELRRILRSTDMVIDKRGRMVRLRAREEWKAANRKTYQRAWELAYHSRATGYIASHPDTVLGRRNF